MSSMKIVKRFGKNFEFELINFENVKNFRKRLRKRANFCEITENFEETLENVEKIRCKYQKNFEKF